jgi:aspartate aminotransferase
MGALRDVPGFECVSPEGAFYAFPNVRGCLRGKVRTSAELADKLLDEQQTVVTDGAGFGAAGYLRISYATSLERLKEGVRRIRQVAESCAV